MGQEHRPQRTKDPGESLVYGFDWTDALNTGETPNTAAWSISSTAEPSPDLQVDPGSETVSGNVSSCRLTGGTVGVTYIVECTMQTSPSSDTHVRSLELRIKNK